jgi:type IV secretory pathway TraG/TraD family ATPase VirD4
MTTPPPKVIGQGATMTKVLTFVVVGVLAAAAYGVLQAGHRMETDRWLPGGANPGSVLLKWGTDGAPLNQWHAILGAAALILLLLLFAAALLSYRRLTRNRVAIDKIAKYMGDGKVYSEKAVRQHAATANLTTGDVVGLPVAQVVRTKQWFWAGFRDGAVAIMGPGSGKTQAVVVTLGLDAPGALWVTSNRSDVPAAFWSSRADKGRFYGFDPQGVADLVPEFYYDPLGYVRAKPEAADVRSFTLATQFAEASRPQGAKTDAYFEPAGTTLVGNFLLAAALDHLPIGQVLTWTTLQSNPLAVEILRKHGQHDSADQVKSVQALVHETRGSIFQAAANQISFLKNDAARPWVQRMGSDDDRPEFDPREYVRSSDTFVCLSREGVGSFGPLVAAMTNAVIEAAEDYAKTLPGGRLAVPMAMLLDEVANVCPIQSLPNLVSHAGGRGIFILPILQSPGQGKACWGEHGWDKLWGASVIRLVGRGLVDIEFLRGISEAVGDQDVQRISHTKSSGRGGGGKSSNTGWTSERILSVADLVAMPQWRALAVAAGTRPALLKLRPHWEREAMATRVKESASAFSARHPNVLIPDERAEVEAFRPSLAMDAD